MKNEATGTENEHRAHPRSGLGCAWQAQAWWAAHGSPGVFMGCARQPLSGVVSCARPWVGPKDERMVDGPLEELVFLNNCNLLVFLGWAKIVAI